MSSAPVITSLQNLQQEQEDSTLSITTSSSTTTTVTNKISTLAGITLSPQTLPAATTGTLYSPQFSASGGSGGYTYSVTNSNLPSSLTLDASGLLSGTPGGGDAGSYYFTVVVKDSAGNSTQWNDNLTINQGGSSCPTTSVAVPAATNQALPRATYGSSYSVGFSGYPISRAYTWNAWGLPDGFSIDYATGIVAANSVPASAIGPHAVTVTVGDTSTGCYGTVTYSLLVSKAPLFVKASTNDINYDDPAPSSSSITVGYSGFVGTDTLATSVAGSLGACSIPYAQGDAAGSYNINCAMGTLDSSTYAFYDSAGRSLVMAPSAGSALGTLTVKPVPLTITASDATMIYGGVVPVITASYSGFVNGDTASSLTADPICTTSVTSSSNTATHATSCSGAVDSNYTFSYVNGTLTVSPAPLTITAHDATMTYGGTVPTVTPSYAGFVNSDTASSLSTAPTCTTAATSSSNTGAYTTSCSGAVDSNYTIAYETGTLIIKPAPLTITAGSPPMIYGGTVPTINPIYSGFVNSDTAASLTTAPTCGTPVTSSSNTGAYTTSCSGAVDSNYSFTYQSGKLTVNPAAATVTVPATDSGPFQVDTAGGTATVPLTATLSASQGDLTTATVTYTLTNGSGATSSCTVGESGGTASVTSTTGSASCSAPTMSLSGTSPLTTGVTFSGLPVDVYSLSVSVGGGNYTATPATADFPVYDPSAGFVTGGGWIDSLTGDCSLTTLCANATGKATFGFVSRYQKGATVPSGNTRFQFRAGGMDFQSSSYQWLVIGGDKAQYKGTGTINGQGSYGFLLTAEDAALSNGQLSTDTFRIKIWDTTTGATVYDNGTQQPIAGGSIIIHS